ncbi:lipase [Artomyces pyxidatus]|uniref:Lipase n=1 Tax=Artomyces pyxidatus TaxID=48021 RepID=A0ACB8TF77_9AGAM|nr:lipase [Artomyces pyxidatus]
MVSSVFTLATAAAAFVFSSVQAAPLRRQSITSLPKSETTVYQPFAYYASASYCGATSTLAWDCGAACDANSGFQPVASGGDGDGTQYWFVGYDPHQDTVIVSHQGTKPLEFLSDLTDAKFFLASLNETLFPGIDSGVEVHNGFASQQASTAPAILDAVKTSLSRFNTRSVTLTGHSLGAALSLLDTVFLSLNLPEDVALSTIGYGLPRVGNQAWADYLDANIQVTHINNQEDPVPTLPGQFLGFHHPSGEIHIQDTGVWDVCPGQDNPSDLCIVGDVSNVFEGSISDHDGPYDGVTMGSC